MNGLGIGDGAGFYFPESFAFPRPARDNPQASLVARNSLISTGGRVIGAHEVSTGFKQSRFSEN